MTGHDFEAHTLDFPWSASFISHVFPAIGTILPEWGLLFFFPVGARGARGGVISS